MGPLNPLIVPTFEMTYSFNGDQETVSGLSIASVADTAFTLMVDDTTTIEYFAENSLIVSGFANVLAPTDNLGGVGFIVLGYDGEGTYPLLLEDEENERGVRTFIISNYDDNEFSFEIAARRIEGDSSTEGQLTVTDIGNGKLKANFSFYAEADDDDNTTGRLEGNLEVDFNQ